MGAGVERIVDKFLQDDLAQVFGVTSGLLWQRREIREQTPVLGFVEQAFLSLTLTALAFGGRNAGATAAFGCHSSGG
jgi:hypothetical protein